MRLGHIMRIELLVSVCFGTLVAFGPAFGASQWDRLDCAGADPDRKMAACTRVLNDSGESQSNRAAAYTYRGMAWRDKGDFDRAIADFDEAIRLDPNSALAYAHRGTAWQNKGDYKRVIADLTEAISLDPTLAPAYVNRGFSHMVEGDADRAIADYTEAIRLNVKDASTFGRRGAVYFIKGDFVPSAQDFLRAAEIRHETYSVLFRYLASSRAGQNASAELEANAGRLVTKAWPYAVIELHLGRHSPAVTREAAGNHRCEADFHIGEWHLIRGERAEARRLMRAVADTCSKNSIEYGIAVAELKRLQP